MTPDSDYYDLLGVDARRRRRRRSRPPIASSRWNAIPTAMAAAPTRKRISRRSARPMTSSRIRRSAPPMTASARPRSRMAAAAATRSAAGGGLRGLFRHFLDRSSASSWIRAGSAQNAARGADLRYDLEIDARRGVRRAEQDHHHRGARRSCEPLRRARARRATAGARACGTCGGAGKVRAQQGFFVVERGCPTCHGRGRDDRRSVPRLRRRRPRAQTPQALSVNIPAGVDEGTRIRVAGEGECGHARRAVRRSLHLSST